MKGILNILIALLLLTSCSDFLEPKSQTEYVPKDVSSLNELLLGSAYIRPGDMSVNIFAYNEIFSDDVACTVDNPNHFENTDQYTIIKPYFAWRPDMFLLAEENSNYPKVWANTYSKILGCNAVLDYLPKVTGTQLEIDYVKGQALALRAFYYFNMVNLFGEPYYYNKTALGVPLKLTSDMEFNYLSRSTVEEVYEQIEADLHEAERCYNELPLGMQFIKDGRITLPMIQHLIARTALFKGDYEKCASYSQKVIYDWDLQLLNLNNFTSTSQQPYYDFTSWNNPEAVWLFGDSYDFTKLLINRVYLLPTSTYQMRYLLNASPSLVSSFEEEDLRLDNYIVKESTSINNYSPYGKTPVNSTYNLISTKFGKSLRLSEGYLMLAESYYFLDKPSEAVELLEELRLRRFTTDSDNAYQVPEAMRNGDALFELIKEERRRELCFEGLRWFDQRRWGMESFSRDWKENGEIVATFVMEKNDPAFTLPIPHDAIELNTNLEQNRLSTPKY